MRDYISKLILLVVIYSGCSLPDPADDPELVSNLRFSPSAFDSFRRNTELKYTLKSPCIVTVCITQKDTGKNERLIRTLLENASETKGTHSVTWLGETNMRYFAPAGSYSGILKIKNRRFETNVQVFHF